VLVAGDLASGRLVRPFASSPAISTDRAYYLVTSEQTAELPRVQAFRAWLLDQVAAGEAVADVSRRSRPAMAKLRLRRSRS
jgi:LysR family glycine cleavage system transcriptional activator